MNNPDKISAVVITYNEENNIGRCLESLMDTVDEIVVVDSYSSDATGEICKGKIFYRSHGRKEFSGL